MEDSIIKDIGTYAVAKCQELYTTRYTTNPTPTKPQSGQMLMSTGQMVMSTAALSVPNNAEVKQPDQLPQ